MICEIPLHGEIRGILSPFKGDVDIMSIERETFEKIKTFLNSIGIEVQEVAAAKLDGFLPGIEIRRGGMLCDPSIAKTTDLLHEAGHLAVLPSRFRKFASGDVDESVQPHFEKYMESHPFLDQNGHEDPIIRGILQSGETEAIAWSWAAGRHLGIPDEEIMPDDGVFAPADGPDEVDEPGGEDTRARLKFCQYLGINGLQAAGMTATNVMKMRDGVQGFPEMLKWVQD